MMSLDQMRDFVCNNQATVACPQCKDGCLVFVPSLIIYPVFDPDTTSTRAAIGVNSILDSQTCGCDNFDQLPDLRSEVAKKFEEELTRQVRASAQPAEAAGVK